MANPEKFLERYSGKIVGVGDIFDHYRSSVSGETSHQYLKRTEKYWTHLSDFVVGNHDSALLKYYKSKFQPVEVYKNNSVIALHGHQLSLAFNKSKISMYEGKWLAKVSEKSLLWDAEEWFCKVFNRYFIPNQGQATALAMSILRQLDAQGLLTPELDTVITGHTHLPFRVKVVYKGKKYRVVNLGSSLHGKKFNPIYVRSIDKWFVSDLHLGTAKSKLN